MKKSLISILSALMLSVSCQEKVTSDIAVSHEDNLKADTLRVISYNILEGMKLDADNNYNKFVEWVNQYNPDVLALEEANGLNKEMLSKLAERWGHHYVETNCNYPGASSFPVAITSKYEIEDVRHIVDNVWHGAIFAKIKGINIVVLHLYPFSDLKENAEWDNPEDMDNDNDIDGNDYRTHELKLYMKETIVKYPARPMWLMMGDFNSFSPLDADHYTTSQAYGTHEVALEMYYDLLKEMHREFNRTTPTLSGGWNENRTDGKRLDYIYGSQAIVQETVRTDVIYDEFTDHYSDHYPILLDLRIYQNHKRDQTT